MTSLLVKPHSTTFKNPIWYQETGEKCLVAHITGMFQSKDFGLEAKSGELSDPVPAL